MSFPRSFPRRRHWTALAGLALLLAGLGCGAGNQAAGSFAGLFATETPTATPLPTVAPLPTAAPLPPTPLPPAAAAAAPASLSFDSEEQRLIAIYERTAASVVNITTQVLRRDFFYNVLPEEGSGSGFVLDQQGHILTNYHVIEGAQQIEVSFGDETVLPAEVVGEDRRNDLAVVKVDAPADLLRPLELGESANLRVGQWAIAIGNPFGQFDRTLTLGVISAVNRTLEGDAGAAITGVIQTDAAINSGNSGGPLLDSQGRVIGINTAIFSPSGTNAGVGFAVPVDTIKRVLPDLLQFGYYRHPWLGLRYGYTLTPALADALDLPATAGILLVQATDGSPLEQAGVRGATGEIVVGNQRVYGGGDILTALDGWPIAAYDTLNTRLEDNYRVGDTVTLTILRAGAEMQVQMLLSEEPR